MDNNDINDDWEDWDGTSPFWMHCVAGSVAGCIEHAALYPLDTVRTHIQVCAACMHHHPHQDGPAPLQKQQQQRGSGCSKNGRSSSWNTATTTSSSSNGNNHTRMFWSNSTAALQHQQRLPLGMWGTIRYLMNEPSSSWIASIARTAASHDPVSPSTTTTASTTTGGGIARLFRGISTVWMGCIPAHALYFSSYEGVKHALSDSSASHTAPAIDPVWVSAAAGAAAVTGHDLIMTPLDTLKQRFQLGYYTKHVSVAQAMAHTLRTEGTVYQSIGVTLATNIPYGMLMVATQDAVRNILAEAEGGSSTTSSSHEQVQQQYSTSTLLLASSCGGFVASGLTTPLDRIKTALQTQAILLRHEPAVVRPCPHRQAPPPGCVAVAARPSASSSTIAAVRTILHTEGVRGLWRGIVPRVLSHTPAVAISWTTYETVKQWLLLWNTTSAS